MWRRYRAVQDTDAVVHLAAAKTDEKDSEEINVGGARNLVANCRATGCLRIVNISTRSAKILRKGLYAQPRVQPTRCFTVQGWR